MVAVTAGGETTQADVIMAAGAAESGSEHPIAKAITSYARARGSLATLSKLQNTPASAYAPSCRIQCGYSSTRF